MGSPPVVLGSRNMTIAHHGPDRPTLAGPLPFSASFKLIHVVGSRLTGGIDVTATVTAVNPASTPGSFEVRGTGSVRHLNMKSSRPFLAVYDPSTKEGEWTWLDPER